MPITDQLREAITSSGQTHYRIALESGVDTRAIDRFVSGEGANIRASTIDDLCVYFGLELCDRKQRAGKKPATASKQRQK